MKYAVVVFCLLALSVDAQSFDSADAMRNYQKSLSHANCNDPKHQDKWAIRRPNEQETYSLGSKVLIFEYWNSVHKCSDSFKGSVYFENKRFMLEVQVDTIKDDDREVITLDTLNTLYFALDKTLVLEDGEQPGRIILYPLTS